MFSNRSHSSFIALIALLFISLPGVYGLGEIEKYFDAHSPAEAVAGTLDLRNHNFETDGNAILSGQWDFFWSDLVRPGEDRVNSQYIHSGGSWRDSHPDQGYATYRLRILLPEDSPFHPLQLEYREIGTAARLYWNGEKVLSIGEVARNPAFARGAWRSGISPPLEYASEVELLVHISNYDNISGGIIDDLRLGTSENISRAHSLSTALNFLLLGVLLIMGIYHLFMFFYRRTEAAAFWFALTSLLLGLRVLVVDTFLVSLLFPEISFAQQMALNYLSFSIPMITVTLFIHSTYKSRFGTMLSWFGFCGSAVYSTMIIILSPVVYSSYLFFFQIFALILVTGLSGIVLWAVFSKKPFSISFAFGFIILLIAAVYDIIKTILLLPLPSLTSLAMVLFILVLALNLSRRGATALRESEDLTRRLKQLNSSMERFVPREFLAFLKKDKITEVSLGDHSQETLTVLFADLENFSGLAENNAPANVFGLLNEFLAEAGPVIRRNGGFVDKYLGDGIMSLFSGDPGKAVQAAIELHQKVDHLNEKRGKLGLEPIAIGVGIHQGECMLGTIGESQRMDGTVISDAVNLSFRLQNLTRRFKAKILVSEETMRAAEKSEQFYQRKIGKLSFKGRTGTLSVVEIINADPPEIWKQKRSTRRNFQKAVTLISTGKTAEAKSILEDCTKAAPDDAAADYYLKQLK